jgi:hypothetical protein
MLNYRWYDGKALQLLNMGTKMQVYQRFYLPLYEIAAGKFHLKLPLMLTLW